MSARNGWLGTPIEAMVKVSLTTGPVILEPSPKVSETVFVLVGFCTTQRAQSKERLEARAMVL